MKFTIRCKQLREIDDFGAQNLTGTVAPEPIGSYVEASFESSRNKVNYYLSIPKDLLDDSVQIGDEYEVTISKSVRR